MNNKKRTQLPSQYQSLGTRVEQSKIAQVYFAYNERLLDANDRAVLDRLIREHREAAIRIERLGGKMHFQIVGHADRRGSASYNQQLALARAQAVEKYLDSRFHRPCCTSRP